MKKWLIHQPPEEAAKQIRSGSDLSMLCAQVLASRGMHNVQEAAAFYSVTVWQIRFSPQIWKRRQITSTRQCTAAAASAFTETTTVMV